MRIFVTGGTGFIGSHVVRKLKDRGDDVVALVRSPQKAAALDELGVKTVTGDLSDRAVIAEAMSGCHSAIHGAAVYEVGIPKSQHAAMYEANVRGTENVLGAALDAKLGRIVYISTVAAFGNTHGEVVDETYEHPGQEFTSYYEQTKYEAHKVAKDLIAQGLPCVIVQPGGVFGPNDHSTLGQQIDDFLDGKMPAVSFPDVGFSLTHVEDIAGGVVLALDRGSDGESYVLAGDRTTMRGMIEATAELAGKKAPKRNMPTGAIKAIAPFGPVVGKLMGLPPNIRELITSSDGVTFWATDEKARQKLGYAPRPMRDVLGDIVAAHD